MSWLEPPEFTTVLRWILRAILISFLVWLVRRRQEAESDDEEDEGEAQETDASASKRLAQTRPGRAARPVQGVGRQSMQQRRPGDAFNNNALRQRRPGGAEDINEVIDRLSKPKEMWEARKSGEPLQIKRQAPPAAAVSSAPSGKQLEETASDNPLSALLGTTATTATPTSGVLAAGGLIPPGGGTKMPPPALAKERAARAREDQRNTLHGHSRPVTCITWNKEGNLLFTCGKDKIICVWSFPDGECLGKYEGHSGAIWSCSITVDSRWLVSGGADYKVIVWEARTSRELGRVELPGVVRCVEWAAGTHDSQEELPPTERFVTCHNKFGKCEPQLTIWTYDSTADAESCLVATSRISGLPTSATQVRWGLRDETVASSHETGELIIWSVETGQEVQRLKAHAATISKFDFSSDYQLLVTVSLDKTVKIWDLAEGSVGELLYHTETDRPLNGVAMGPLSRDEALAAPAIRPSQCCVIAAGGQDVRDVAGSAVDGQFETLLLSLGGSSKDGQEDSRPAGLEVIGSVKGHFGPVHTLAFSSDGKAIASGSEDGYVRLHTFDKSNAGGQQDPA